MLRVAVVMCCCQLATLMVKLCVELLPPIPIPMAGDPMGPMRRSAEVAMKVRWEYEIPDFSKHITHAPKVPTRKEMNELKKSEHTKFKTI